jgi:hypothetical protein
MPFVRPGMYEGASKVGWSAVCAAASAQTPSHLCLLLALMSPSNKIRQQGVFGLPESSANA